MDVDPTPKTAMTKETIQVQMDVIKKLSGGAFGEGPKGEKGPGQRRLSSFGSDRRSRWHAAKAVASRVLHKRRMKKKAWRFRLRRGKPGRCVERLHSHQWILSNCWKGNRLLEKKLAMGLCHLVFIFHGGGEPETLDCSFCFCFIPALGISHCARCVKGFSTLCDCSLEQILLDRERDPEDVLTNLGFGSTDSDPGVSCRVPDRFLTAQVRHFVRGSATSQNSHQSERLTRHVNRREPVTLQQRSFQSIRVDNRQHVICVDHQFAHETMILSSDA